MEAYSWIGVRGEKWRAQLEGMEAMLVPVDAPLMGALALTEPLRILDVGCGGGGTTLSIHRDAPSGSEVLGIDISPGLIEAARFRATSLDGRLAFQLADMTDAPAPAEPYQRLVSRFGTMFFERPEAAVSNMARWLSPGARFAFAVWGPLAENPWMKLARDVVSEVVPLQTPEPDAPGPFRYANPNGLLSLLERCGFGELEKRELRVELPIGGGLATAEAADFALVAFANFAELLEQAGRPAFERARGLLIERFAKYEVAGIVQLGALVHIVVGTRAMEES